VDAVNQIIVAKWFWQVANNSETKGLGSNIFIRLSGNQNGGNAAAKRLEGCAFDRAHGPIGNPRLGADLGAPVGDICSTLRGA
jgi:hypothetical protein